MSELQRTCSHVAAIPLTNPARNIVAVTARATAAPPQRAQGADAMSTNA
jgi:hypothetical protein